MWWFLNKSSKGLAPGAPPVGRVASEEELLRQIPDMSALMAHDAAIKICLPEPVARLVKWMADAEGNSQSAWLRERLFEYVYGRAAAQAHRIRCLRSGDDSVRFLRGPVDRSSGRYVYLVPQLGKNTIGFKLWLATQMQEDLQKLAQHAGIKPSAFAREVIISDLLGHGSVPERPGMFEAASEATLAWERGEEVLCAVVEAADYEKLGDAEKRWVASDSAAASRAAP